MNWWKMYSESTIKNEIIILVETIIVMLVGIYVVKQQPTFYDFALIHTCLAIKTRVKQTDFWITRG